MLLQGPGHTRVGCYNQNHHSYPMLVGVLFFLILPMFVFPSYKFLPFVLFSPPSFFPSPVYFFFLTGFGIRLIFKIFVIHELTIRCPGLNFKSLFDLFK